MTSEPASARGSCDPATSHAYGGRREVGHVSCEFPIRGIDRGRVDVAQHAAGVDVLTPHAGSADLGMQHADHPVRRRSPHRRSDAPRPGLRGILSGADRREVHHDTVAALDHRGDQPLEEDERVQCVGLQNAIDEIDRDTERRVVEPGSLVAGTAHHDIDTTERGQRRIGGQLDRHEVGEVHLDHDDARAVRPALLGRGLQRTDLLHACGRVVEACPEIGRRTIGRPCRDHQVEAVGRERDGRSPRRCPCWRP